MSNSSSSGGARLRTELPAGRGADPTRENGFSLLTTDWNGVKLASKDDPKALEQLLANYSVPFVSWLRNSGLSGSHQEAQDCFQDFVADRIREVARQAEPSKGRFRSFLFRSVQHFAIDRMRLTKTQKRGGAVEVISLDEQTALGDSILLLPADNPSASDERFDSAFAHAFFSNVINALERDYKQRDQSEVFQNMRPFLTDSEGVSQQSAASASRMTEGAFRVALLRCRKRYAELLRLEAAKIVEKPEDVDDEIRYLLKVASR